ncbi:hypothetical protein ACTHOQ_01745 [Solibacillus silvestris]|uniref:hypothetical protein n=1 Tax=Solibacillus silvestris TaxID=76853 RepID=UPI003F812D70
MHKYLYIQYTTMIVVCFICGVACYQLFQIEQVLQIIKFGDRRILNMEKPEMLWSVVPFIVALSIVLFFSTHKYLPRIALVFIAIKVTFLGFSSVYLLVQHQSVKLYAFWWFPFQLVYCVLLIVLYQITNKNSGRRALKSVMPWKKVIFLLFVMLFIFALENFAITYLFK